MILLREVRKGDTFKVVRIDDRQIRTQLLRFGLGEGSTAKCFERLPAGPIVIKHQRQEVALGREIADKIWVELLAQ
ncbi:MAG: ferrous iron transport protein A [Chloroherpetonaceae bacterium]|nr:ferrous iron transport protein A [Chloroherpetonaceae bacterium]MCS7212548.1 ferrous iron transport protein A [Chloroherpetonaceae bacterium]MDW8018711.1 ferrous iron transport protein A [Chloroherpetonaceae bacterium]MDW8466320.1 ferrous iron transport protein A [Chloroherpetonaceae bacterium]